MVGAALIVTGLAFTDVARDAFAAETGVYQPPDMHTFLLVGSEEGDGDGDGVNETQILRYRSVSQDHVFSMTTKDRLWAWSLESHDMADTGHNYVIRDSNCDGTFDERYTLDEEFHVPDCLE